jgi:hypothetical protein
MLKLSPLRADGSIKQIMLKTVGGSIYLINYGAYFEAFYVLPPLHECSVNMPVSPGFSVFAAWLEILRPVVRVEVFDA